MKKHAYDKPVLAVAMLAPSTIWLQIYFDEPARTVYVWSMMLICALAATFFAFIHWKRRKAARNSS